MERIEENLRIDFTKEAAEGLPSISLSKILGFLTEEKDQQKIVDATYNKHFNNPESEYYQKSKEEILDMWAARGAASCHYGALNDEYIGCLLEGTEKDLKMFMLDNDAEDDERLAGLIHSTNDFFETLTKSGDTVLVAREAPIHFTFGSIDINGRIDSIYYNTKTKKYIVVDYKTSKSIDKSNRWARLKGPAKLFDDCNWVTYTIQGFTYKYGLLNNYLPEGVTEDDVEFIIVQLPGFELPSGKWFEIHKPAFKYDKTFMERLFTFVENKYTLLNE